MHHAISRTISTMVSSPCSIRTRSLSHNKRSQARSRDGPSRRLVGRVLALSKALPYPDQPGPQPPPQPGRDWVDLLAGNAQAAAQFRVPLYLPNPLSHHPFDEIEVTHG